MSTKRPTRGRPTRSVHAGRGRGGSRRTRGRGRSSAETITNVPLTVAEATLVTTPNDPDPSRRSSRLSVQDEILLVDAFFEVQQEQQKSTPVLTENCISNRISKRYSANETISLDQHYMSRSEQLYQQRDFVGAARPRRGRNSKRRVARKGRGGFRGHRDGNHSRNSSTRFSIDGAALDLDSIITAKTVSPTPPTPTPPPPPPPVDDKKCIRRNMTGGRGISFTWYDGTTLDVFKNGQKLFHAIDGSTFLVDTKATATSTSARWQKQLNHKKITQTRINGRKYKILITDYGPFASHIPNTDTNVTKNIVGSISELLEQQNQTVHNLDIFKHYFNITIDKFCKLKGYDLLFAKLDLYTLRDLNMKWLIYLRNAAEECGNNIHAKKVECSTFIGCIQHFLDLSKTSYNIYFSEYSTTICEMDKMFKKRPQLLDFVDHQEELLIRNGIVMETTLTLRSLLLLPIQQYRYLGILLNNTLKEKNRKCFTDNQLRLINKMKLELVQMMGDIGKQVR